MTWRKYTQEMLQEAVDNSTSVAGVLRHLGLNQAGGTHAHISRMLKKMSIDTSHFVRYVGTGAHARHSADEILVVRPQGSGRAKPPMLRRALLEIGRPYVCAECGCGDEWRGRPIRLHIDHVDGDFHNNVAENLRFLCPNCHSQTPNFSGASRGKYTLIGG
ncbi:hypothetical protein FB381_4020 [Nocardioides albertanoniae]|uniref:HNH nuclease domain-containing protein n=1 Tax=Nocardioides albertanoniae TaxID=1175486 RepID=A0A543ABW6_9ACTN|nr:HNH endonuclease signature motif containing protein [Nocardioides albertanoniae]TQL70093.1 hypothetical protein FB381_4020 [Nocardioides albertanoniae]